MHKGARKRGGWIRSHHVSPGNDGMDERDDRESRRRLGTGRERPYRRRATDAYDELAPSHSITSSAKAISCGGTSRPRVLAVFRLMISSKLVGCSTGKSPGFPPLRILPQ